jgi:nucleolar MIF4G domain-containing protein 1
MVMQTQIQSRKERRKEERKRKRKHGKQDSLLEQVQELKSDVPAPKRKKDRKPKKAKLSEDPYSSFDSSAAAAIRRDDDEIEDLERKLGMKKNKDKSKLHKEYAKLEGYGDDFGEFLDDLDGMMLRVTANEDESEVHQTIMSDEDGDDASDNESSDDEEIVPMKEPFEALDEDDSVLAELEIMEQEADLKHSMEVDNEEASASESDSDDQISKVSEGQEGHSPDALSSEDKRGRSSDDESGDNSDEESQSSNEQEPDHDITDTYTPSAGEDIYGKNIDSTGDGSEKPKKYVPPHLRKAQVDDDGQKERLRLIQRSLNNAMNRLSEDTLISVAQQLSELFAAHPTQLVQQMMWKNTKDACVLPSMLMKGLIPIYIACIVGAHIQTGDTVQIGEYMLEMIVGELWRELKLSRCNSASQEDESGSIVDLEKKRICNLVLLLCYLYNYSIIHCSFMYDIIRHLIENFSEGDIECLLLLLRHCGKSLRSDDPLALKQIVLLVQKKKSEDAKSSSSSRADYMLSAIMDLKNNKRTKQDDRFSEKTAKLRKMLGRIKSSAKSTKKSESSLRLSLQDILNAETKGRWWKVGASWVGNQHRLSEDGSDSKQAGSESTNESSSKGSKENETLLRLASKYRMNTDRKRSIFCIIMGGADCEDAFEKLCRSSVLHNRSERDTVRVLMECCGNEKSYNKFYGHLANRMCEYQPQCRFSLQLAYWDTFKQFDTMEARKAANLAKLMFHLVATHQTLKLMTVIKAIEIDEDMDQAGLIFLTILLTDILEYYDDPSLVKAQFASSSGKSAKEEQAEQEEGFRASLLVFFLETLKDSPKNKKGSKYRKNFKAAVKALDADGFESMF